jgi:hypothetical protein
MNEVSPELRKRWYRHFPEGSLEFLVATRVLAVILLLAMLVMRDPQRPLLLTALIGVLWCDYALVLWWAIQVRLDLDLLGGRQTPRPRRWLLAIKAFLPSIVAACALAPWPSAYGFALKLVPGLAAQGGPNSPAYHRLSFIGFALAAVVFVALVLLAYRTLQRIHLGKSHWTALSLIPGIHWFALHRIAADLETDIHEQQARHTHAKPHSTGSTSMAAADVTWALCILPWLFVIVITCVRAWPGSTGQGPAAVLPFCGMLMAAIFAIADLAALERVQRQFVALAREP